MIEVLGWFTLMFGGAYVVFNLGVILGLGVFFRGGLESLPPSLYLGTASALAWIAAIFWLGGLHD